MPRYFQNMPQVGKPLKKADAANEEQLKKIEEEIHQLIKEAQEAGKADADVNKRGELTALQRIEKLVEPGSWRPLHTLFNPQGNKNGSVAIDKRLGRVNGKWCVDEASDTQTQAGAWVPGQAECLLRASDTAKTLHVPLVYVLNCSGVTFDEQEKVYPNRRGGGTPFFRNAELNQLGIPVIVGIYGTNPAGGGYHSISPTVIIAHEKANMAVGGAGIMGGMNPKGHVDLEYANEIADMVDRTGKTEPPGAVDIHYTETGFMREVYASEEGVLEGIKKYVGMLPKYHPEFFRVDDPKAPAFPADDLYSMVPLNDKRAYDIYNVIARLFDNSELHEYKKGYGPEMVTGLAKVNGLLVGVVANVQGLLMNYPEYKAAGSVGIGGKLYRQGLVKMNEFVTLCARDRLPIVWIQDTTGIDVGNDAEKAELLGLGQSLIYSIQTSHIPQFEITLRKGTAAAHYVLGGPQGNATNAFSIGPAASEIAVMNGETAATAMYSRRLAKDRIAGKELQPTIDKMNNLIQAFYTKSRPKVCAELGLVDEIVDMNKIRGYVEAFTEAAYQNPESICPFHQMLLPRAIREFETFVKK